MLRRFVRRPTYRAARAICVSALLAATSALATAPDQATSDAIAPAPEKLAALRAGNTDTARAVWWGFDPRDATDSLQSALESRADTVVVENVGRPWIVRPLDLPSNKTVLFEPGVVIEARRGHFRSKGACLMTARHCKNLTLRGPGAVLRMHKRDYQAPPYEAAEWRHTLSIRGCEDIEVVGLTFRASGGDGIYLGTGSDRRTNRRITIREVLCDDNHRQGISVITAEDLTIEDCVFRGTHGTPPEAGIDFEPNHADERLVRCVLKNCRSENNGGHAYHVYLGNMNRRSTPVSIRLENCASSHCDRYSVYLGMANRQGERTVTGSIQLTECRFEKDHLGGVFVRGNEADGCEISLADCTIVRPKTTEASNTSPIHIEAPRGGGADAGNLRIVDCRIIDPSARRPLSYAGSPLTRLRDVSGCLVHETPEGRNEVVVDQAQLVKWFPDPMRSTRVEPYRFSWHALQPATHDARRAATAPWSPKATLRFRRAADLIAWTTASGPVKIEARYDTIGNRSVAPGTFTLLGPEDQSVPVHTATRGNVVTIRFTPNRTGPHRLTWASDPGTTLEPLTSNVPLSAYGEGRGLHFFRPSGTLHFAVPPRVKRFAVEVAGAGDLETVRATIRDGDGNVVASRDNVAAPHAFILEVPARQPVPRVWSMTLTRASRGILEDVTIHTLGVPAVFSPTPGDVLLPTID